MRALQAHPQVGEVGVSLAAEIATVCRGDVPDVSKLDEAEQQAELDTGDTGVDGPQAELAAVGRGACRRSLLPVPFAQQRNLARETQIYHEGHVDMQKEQHSSSTGIRRIECTLRGERRGWIKRHGPVFFFQK